MEELAHHGVPRSPLFDRRNVDLVAIDDGAKVQATGDALYLGVIRQDGQRGFYRLTVSEE